MQYGKIIGTAICTIKYSGLEGVKLLLIQPLNRKHKPVGEVVVAADMNQAGIGDICGLTKSHEASLTLENSDVPVDLATVGIIDKFDYIENEERKTTLIKGWNIFT